MDRFTFVHTNASGHTVRNADSAKLLDQLIANHDGDNLVHALCFNEFATEKAAERFVFEVRA